MRIPRPYAPALALCLLAGAVLFAQTAKSTFENAQVLINERHGQPHDHKLNRVMIYFQPGGEVLHYVGGADVTLRWAAGDVKWSPASGMHVSEVPPAMKLQDPAAPVLVDIGIKRPGDPTKLASTALDPLRVDPAACKLEFENAQVRVLRVRIGPRQTIPLHEHALNHVTVYLTPHNVRETSSDGKSEVKRHNPGDFTWDAPCKHKVENLDDKPVEAVVVELKN